MPRGGTIGHRKTGGRVKGTPNKRSLTLRAALEAHGCHLEEQIAHLLRDPAVEAPLKAEVVAKLLPYIYPQLRPVDPDGMLSPEQAAGMLGRQALTFREALRRYVTDETIIARVLDDLRAHTTNGSTASAAAV